MAFGQLKLSPFDFEWMTIREFVNAIEGHRFSEAMHEGWIRRSAFLIAASFGGKPKANSWRIDLLDGVPGGAAKLGTRDGQYEILKEKGFSGYEHLSDEDLKHLRREAGKFHFIAEDGTAIRFYSQIRKNIRRIKGWCKSKGVTCTLKEEDYKSK